ncbi:MAG: DUF1553 domain-containing protein [Verrucomicrobia bacterium]|nr:DUF1553 domain-containing protein [Verrucomicrobiota bacterium]
MKTFLISAVIGVAVWGGATTPSAKATPFESDAALSPQTKIDEAVFASLKKLNIEPASICSDAVFVRRVFLDLIGTLPTAKEAKEFLEDKDPKKRSALIDRLMERDEFADYWAMKWGDLLRIRAEFPINLWPNAAQAYHRWVRDSLRENMPYDKFVREMLTSNGSNFRVGQVNFYRAVQSKDQETIAKAVALTFMGTRAENWPKEQLAGMAQFFSKIAFKQTGEWKEEIIFFDPAKTATLATNNLEQATTAPAEPAEKKKKGEGSKPAKLAATFPDGTPAKIAEGRDPRVVFADWLISPKNPWFGRNIVNRVWSWFLERGIIHEPDDIRPDNKPVNPELLAYLEKELVAGKYDLKHLFRLILNSQTYQLSSVPKSKSPEAEANFARYPLRRLEAEVLIDALNQITGTTEKYSSPVPEPFTFIPEDQRSISLPDSSITSSFLEMFGRPSRDTGLELERSSKPTTDQRLHMLNSSHIQRKIENSPKLQALFSAASGAVSKPPKPAKFRKGVKVAPPVSTGPTSEQKKAEVINQLYLTILSRFPTEQELKTVAEYMQAGSKREAAVDLAWALVNSAEFLYRH